MATRYIQTSDLALSLGSSGEDALLEQIIERAEAVFDSLAGAADGLITSDKTESHAHACESFFILKTINPTAIKKIDGTAPTAGTYYIEGQLLVLKDAPGYPSTWPHKHVIEYTSGYETAPKDVQDAIIVLASSIYATRNSQGIDSFKQDLLTVNYSSQNILDKIADDEAKTLVRATARKYSVPSVIS